MSISQRILRYGGMLLLAAVTFVCTHAASANEQIRVGKAQGTAWTFCRSISASSKASSPSKGSTSTAPISAATPRCSRRWPPAASISGSAAARAWRSPPKARRSIGVAAFAGAAAQHLGDRARRFADQDRRRPEGQADRRVHGGLAQRLAGQADGDPGRLGPGRHPRPCRWARSRRASRR